MHTESHTWWSPSLGHDMETRVFGRAGQPVVGFPSLGGRVWDLEGFGMVDALAGLIEDGRVRLVCVDGVDQESWANGSIPPDARARRHDDYDRYLADELVAFVQGISGRPTMWSVGCSMGAYHAANVFFRHPESFDGVVGLSGVYAVGPWVGDAGGDAAYFNSPLWYLPHVDDPWRLHRYRQSALVFGVGQGAWEEDCLVDTRALDTILAQKGIPAWFDYWGHDVNHDWPWWHRMLPYFLDRLGAG